MRAPLIVHQPCCNVGLSVQRHRHNNGVFDRQGRAQTQERQHRMRGIAEQRDSAANPGRQRFALEQCPFEQLFSRRAFDQTDNIRVPTLILLFEFRHGRWDRPAFRRPDSGPGGCDAVDQRFPAHGIAVEKSPGADEDRGSPGAHEWRCDLDRQKAAPCHLTGEARHGGPE